MQIIDTHCHLDATAHADQEHVRANLRQAGVALCVLPNVQQAHMLAVQSLARRCGYAYALGLHPAYVTARSVASELNAIEANLRQSANDPHLVAVGEIGLDFFIAAAKTAIDAAALRQLQQAVLAQQLAWAQSLQLPVILHSRAAVEAVRLALRSHDFGGIAHAFNGSWQQAVALLDRGYKLGFGGAALYPRAQHLQDLLKRLPHHAIVLETDAPDMPPPWLYATAAARAQGAKSADNDPLHLPRIALELAAIRGVAPLTFMLDCNLNSVAALPRCAPLLSAACT